MSQQAQQAQHSTAQHMVNSRLTRPSLPPPSSRPAAEDAAHALVEAAHKQWAVRYRGRNCDDVSMGGRGCMFVVPYNVEWWCEQQLVAQGDVCWHSSGAWLAFFN